jgi:hypothetical protein
MLGAQRRIEARIGQLLGEPSHAPETVPYAEHFARRADRNEFRTLAQALDDDPVAYVVGMSRAKIANVLDVGTETVASDRRAVLSRTGASATNGDEKTSPVRGRTSRARPVVSLNVRRRNLSASQRAMAAAEAWGVTQSGQRDDPKHKRLAATFGVAHSYVQQARALVERDAVGAEAVLRGGTLVARRPGGLQAVASGGLARAAPAPDGCGDSSSAGSAC